MRYDKKIIANVSQHGIYVTVHGESEKDQRVFNIGGNLVFASNKDKITRDLIETLRKKAGKKISLEKLLRLADRLSDEREMKGNFFIAGVDPHGDYGVWGKNLGGIGTFSDIDKFPEDKTVQSPVTVEPKGNEKATLEGMAETFSSYRPDTFQFGFLDKSSAKVLYDPDVKLNSSQSVPQREYKRGILSGDRRQRVNNAFYNKLIDMLDIAETVTRTGRKEDGRALMLPAISKLIDAYKGAGYGMLGRIRNRWNLWRAERARKKGYALASLNPFKVSEMRCEVLSDGTPVRQYMSRNGTQPEVSPAHRIEMNKRYIQSFWDSLPAASAESSEVRVAQPPQLVPETALSFEEKMKKRHGPDWGRRSHEFEQRIQDKYSRLQDQD